MSHKTRSEEHIEADGLGLVARTTNDGGKGLQPDLGFRVSHSTAQYPVQGSLEVDRVGFRVGGARMRAKTAQGSPETYTV